MKTSTAAHTVKYRPAAVGPMERSNPPTVCSCCGREDLKKTVPVTDGAVVLWMGRSCAAKACGVGVKEYDRAREAVQSEAAQLESERHRAALALYVEWLRATTGMTDDFKARQALGGQKAALALYTSETGRTL